MVEQGTTEKHQIILDAAQKRFARYGLSKVTMDEIAQDIGMGKASLYYYFPTKESLFQAVIAREMDKFITVMKALLQQDITAGAKLTSYLENRFRYFRDLTNLSTLNCQTFYQMKPIFTDLYEQFARNELELIQSVVEEGRRTGEFQIPDGSETARLLLHLLRGLRFFYQKIMGDRLSEEEKYAQINKEMILFAKIILDGIKNPEF